MPWTCAGTWMLGTRLHEARWNAGRRDGVAAGPRRRVDLDDRRRPRQRRRILFGCALPPDIPGLSEFDGPITTPPNGIRAWSCAQRVAVIGTGASGVQVVPELAKGGRDGHGVPADPAVDGAQGTTGPYSASGIGAFRRNPLAAKWTRWQIWKFQHDFTANALTIPWWRRERGRATDFWNGRSPTRRCAVRPTPGYPFRCKRVLLGDDYYRALQRDNVRLVTEPIAGVSAGAVTTSAGTVVGTDVIVLAAGIRDRGLPFRHRRHRRRRSASTSIGMTPSAYLGAAVSASRTSSCSTGPTPTRAATRSSTSWRPVRAWSPTPSPGSRAAGGSFRRAARAERRYNRRLSADLGETIWTRCDSYFRSPSGRIVAQWPYTELEYARRTRRLRRRDWVSALTGRRTGIGRRDAAELAEDLDQVHRGRPQPGRQSSILCHGWHSLVLNDVSVASICTICGCLLIALSTILSPLTRFQ